MTSFLITIRLALMLTSLFLFLGGFRTALDAKSDCPHDKVQMWVNIICGTVIAFLMLWAFVALWRWHL